MSCQTAIYKFGKVADKIMLSNGDIEAFIPECNFTCNWDAGTNNIIVTVQNCQITPSLIQYSMDEDGVATITIDKDDVAFPTSESASDLADKITLLIDYVPVMQGGTNGQLIGKIADADFAYGFINP